MKHNIGDRVLLYTGGGQVKATVTAATRDEVTIRVWPSGREVVLEGHDDLSRLSKDRGRRRR